MENLYIIRSIKVFLSCMGIFIHSVGIYALTKMRRRTDQVRILINLSVSELIIIVSLAFSFGFDDYQEHHYVGATSYSAFLKNVRNDDALFIIPAFIKYVGVGVTTINLMLLTTDRVIHTVLPLRYVASAQDHEIFKKLIVGSWVFVPLISLLVIYRWLSIKSIYL